jgi:hypothetical protein
VVTFDLACLELHSFNPFRREPVFQFRLLGKAPKLKAACNVTPAVVRLLQNYWICIVQIFDMGILITIKSY